jgi:hypothetical protein
MKKGRAGAILVELSCVLCFVAFITTTSTANCTDDAVYYSIYNI